MRIRTIKPEFWTSLTVASLPVHARLTFIGLWNYCDDEGRAVDDARLIKAALWPLDEYATAGRVSNWVGDLEERGLIQRYEIDGNRYLCVTHWSEHQRVERPKPSVIPHRSVTDTSPKAPRGFTAVLEGKGTGNREQGTGKGDAPAERPRNLLFDALCRSCGMDPAAVPASEARTVAVKAAELARLHPPPSPEDVLSWSADANWARVMPPGTTKTPAGIVNNWARLHGNGRGPDRPTSAMALLESSARHREEESREAERGRGHPGLPERGVSHPA